jgi:hypothetical protein
MSTTHRPMLSRRGFCLCCIAATTFTATGGWLTPREVFAQSRNVVDMIRDDAASPKIKITKLRNDVGVLRAEQGAFAFYDELQNSTPARPATLSV